MKSIIVINDISEDSLFGSEAPSAGYDAQQLQTMLKTRVDAMYPGVDVQVWDSDRKTEVQVDGDDWEVESQIMEIISQVHEIWLDQLAPPTEAAPQLLVDHQKCPKCGWQGKLADLVAIVSEGRELKDKDYILCPVCNSNVCTG